MVVGGIQVTIRENPWYRVSDKFIEHSTAGDVYYKQLVTYDMCYFRHSHVQSKIDFHEALQV